jgi:lipopolysaccharide export system protein LptA
MSGFLRTFLRLASLAATGLSALQLVAATDEPTAEPKRTIVTADRAEARNDGVEAYFVFTDNVHLSGTNLDVTCDILEIWADSSKRSTTDTGPIRRVLATGRVVIRQQGRSATAGRVEILPGEDVVVLTENPVVTDAAGTAAGETIRFYRGRQQLFIDKPRLEGQVLPNMGFPQSSETPPAATPPPSP